MTADQPPAGEAGSVSTGVPGLDEVLRGGLPPYRLYLVEGDPGTGKTTMALQFLLAGAREGETVLYVTLSETADEIHAVARSHGWTLDGITIFELSPADQPLDPEEDYTVFHPAEVELGETTHAVFERVDEVNPTRVVFDSLSEMRLLARDPLRYRRQILMLKHFFVGRHCTVLLLDDRTAPDDDLQLQSIAHGVVRLEQTPLAFGRTRRQLRILKLRGVAFQEGFHDVRIATGGLLVYPALVAAEQGACARPTPMRSDIRELDDLLGGGLDFGTSALFIGPAGCGKSVLALQYAIAAASRGEHAALFLFEENRHVMRARAAGLGLDVDPFIERGAMTLDQIDPAQLPPGEFALRVRQCVERRHAKVVVIDSLNGYLQAMLDERFVVAHLHELVTFLNQHGVLTILIVAQHGIIGTSMSTPVDLTFLADSVIMLRYFEVMGRVRRAISVVKKRTGRHEETIRELRIGPGVSLGPPLHHFQGVLTGVPVLVGQAAAKDAPDA